ncbi:MAG TPA: helix-turn-helix domain-containing protein [Solirubrobacterales bacterium]|nr:helix-turn-helix domain-containing protein [Solirubrobacterales bacterium]
MSKARVVQLLECDPGLADGLAQDERAIAMKALPVQVAALRKGPWCPEAKAPESGHLGYLIVKGLLVRRIEVAQGASIELLGQGELIRPWEEDTSSFCRPSWEVVEATTVAQLGAPIARCLGQWPPLVSNLLGRGVRRSRALAADVAAANIVGLEERLLTALWQLAETWGSAETDGVHLAIRLPHRLLAELMGARRPSVTSALAGLKGDGRLSRTPDGFWILRGEPPH